MTTVLITGATGRVGSALWPRLTGRYDLALLDARADPAAAGVGRVLVGDLADEEFAGAALAGVDVVVHLAGNPRPAATWAQLEGPNIGLSRTLVDAAVRQGVRRIVFASSSHVSGQYDRERTPGVDPRWPARPCCDYGVTKACVEVIARHAADRRGLECVCLRLGAVSERPEGPVGYRFWLSHDDLGRAVGAAIEAEVRYGVYFAASRNARSRWRLDLSTSELGFDPADDAADHRDSVDFDAPAFRCYEGSV